VLTKDLASREAKGNVIRISLSGIRKPHRIRLLSNGADDVLCLPSRVYVPLIAAAHARTDTSVTAIAIKTLPLFVVACEILRPLSKI
jgi:hypothetical protein